MPEQHVGRLSDSIDNDTGVSPRERLARVAKPTGKVFRRTSEYHDLGDGDQCRNAEGELTGHGRMYHTSSGKQYCPHQSHDAERLKPAKEKSDG